VYENIVNTVMNAKGKTNENIKAIINIFLFWDRENMGFIYNGSRVAKLKTSLNLNKNAQLLVYN